MKNLFNQIKASLSKSDVYTQPETLSAKSSIGYIILVVLVVAAIKTIFLGFAFAPIAANLHNGVNDAIERYPADLALTLAKGELSMNRPSPYAVVATPAEANVTKTKNIVVIDTSKTLDFNAFASYDTAVLLTKDGYMTADRNGAIKAQSFKNFSDYTLSKSVIDSYRPTIDAVFGKLAWIIGLFLIVGLFIALSAGSIVAALFLSLLGVLVALIVTRIKDHKLSFSQLYGLSLHAYTIVILFALLNTMLRLPNWIGLVLFVFVLAAFVEKKDQTTVSN